MFNSWEWLVGLTYLRAGQKRSFISFISLISALGLMLGVAVLIVVLSVMNGFERELRTRMLAVTSHATLMGLDGQLANWHEARVSALKTKGVVYAVPYFEAQAMLAYGKRVIGTGVRGIDPDLERAATGLSQSIRNAQLEDLQPGSWRVILGSALAEELGVRKGDSVLLITPEGSATPEGVVPRMRRLHVVGTFESGMYEFDRGLALMNLRDAARLYRLGDTVSGLRLALADPLRAPEVVRQLALSLGGGFYVSDWTSKHANFFRSIEITKGLLFIILSLMVGVAAFNIVATLVMIVKDKQTDIALLRTLGASPRSILRIFVIQGVLIGLSGTLLGALLGLLISHNIEMLVHMLEWFLSMELLDKKVYFMSDLPAYVEWLDVIQVCAIALFLCVFATIYPAWRASKTQPAEVLRHD